MSIAKQLGVTLLELLLVFAVASAVTLMGFKFYNNYQTQLLISEVGQQVGFLFDGLRLFYYANCMRGGLLGQTSTTPIVVLSGGGNTILLPYLIQPVQTQNRLLKYTDSNTYYGYIAQFNLHTTARIPPNTTYQGNGATMVGVSVNWSSEVSIEPANTTILNTLQSSLGAECSSNYVNASKGVTDCATYTTGTPAVYGPECAYTWGPSTYPLPCGASCTSFYSAVTCNFLIVVIGVGQLPTGGNYLISAAVASTPGSYLEFEQLPSYGSGHNTVNSTTLPMLKLFKYQYENSQYQGYQAATVGQNVYTGSGANNGTYQTNYYYCGS
ncbi:MAG: hypothetical protein V4501_11010 [Pseudomonadota bacterium]